MIADTPIDGTLAVATDTRHVGFYSGGAWQFINANSTLPADGNNGEFLIRNGPATGEWRTAEDALWASYRTLGGSVLIPGHFNADPSDTKNPDDRVRLAARYNGQRVSLWTKRSSGWHQAVPEVANPANSGRVVMADANGDAKWESLFAPSGANTFANGRGRWVFSLYSNTGGKITMKTGAQTTVAGSEFSTPYWNHRSPQTINFSTAARNLNIGPNQVTTIQNELFSMIQVEVEIFTENGNEKFVVSGRGKKLGDRDHIFTFEGSGDLTIGGGATQPVDRLCFCLENQNHGFLEKEGVW